MLLHFKTYNLNQCADVLIKLLLQRENLFITQNIGLSNVSLRTYLEAALVDKADVVCNLQLVDLVLVIQSLKHINKVWNKDEYSWGIYSLFSNSNFQSRLSQLLPYSYHANEIVAGANSNQVNAFNYSYSVRLGNIFNQYQFYRPALVLDWLQNDLQRTPQEFHWQAKIYGLLVEYLTQIESGTKHLSKLLMDAKYRDFIAQETVYFVIDRVQPEWFYHQVNTIAKFITVHLISIQPTYYLHANSQDLNTFSDTIYSIAGKYNQQHLLQLEKLQLDAEINQTPPENKADTNLARLQQNLLSVSSSEQTSEFSLANDLVCKEDCHSMQWLQCQTKLSEVMAVRDWILGKISNDPDLGADDFLIASDNMQEYQSVIERVFDVDYTGDLDQGLSISINTQVQQENLAVSVIISLINHHSSEYDLSLLRKLVVFPHLLHSFGIQADEWYSILDFLSKRPYNKGLYSGSNVLKETLQSDLNHLIITSLTLAEVPEDILNVNIQHLLITQNICALLCAFSDQIDKSLNVVAWTSKLQQLQENIYQPAADDGLDDPWRNIFAVLKTLEKISGNSTFDRKSMAIALMDTATFVKQGNVKPKGSIIFANLESSRLLVRTHICFIGMQQHNDAKQAINPFDLIQNYPESGDHDAFDRKMYSILTSCMSAKQSILFTMVDLDSTQHQFNSVVNYLLLKTKQKVAINNFLPEQRQYKNLDILPYQHTQWPFKRKNLNQSAHNISIDQLLQPVAVKDIVHAIYGSLHQPNDLLLSAFLGMKLGPSDTKIKQTDVEISSLTMWQLRKLAFHFLSVNKLWGNFSDMVALTVTKAKFYEFLRMRGKLENNHYSRNRSNGIIEELTDTNIWSKQQKVLMHSTLMTQRVTMHSSAALQQQGGEDLATTVSDIIFSMATDGIMKTSLSKQCDAKKYATHWVEHLLYNANIPLSMTNIAYAAGNISFAGMQSKVAIYYLSQLVTLAVQVRQCKFISYQTALLLRQNYRQQTAIVSETMRELQAVDEKIDGKQTPMAARLNLTADFNESAIEFSGVTWHSDDSKLLKGYLIPIGHYFSKS